MMKETHADFARAELLAADLAGAQIDPNEAQKVLAYLRSQQGNGKALFTYLQTVVSNGRAVIRSRQTLDYYRNLQSACERHLRPLQGDYDQLLATYAWSLQLLRYFRTVPNAMPRRSIDGDPVSSDARAARVTPPPSAPEIPGVGKQFAGNIIDVDETAMLIAIPGFNQEKAIGIVEAEGLQKRFKIGNTARVEVVGTRTQKSGRVIVTLKLARRE